MALAIYRRHADWPALLRLLPGVLPGLVLGAWFVDLVDNDTMRVAIAVVLLAMTGLQLRQRLGRAPTDRATAGRPQWPFTLGMGLLAGFATMVANAAGR
ncbi:MAG: sulfite exporter TauE/SafE family protein [Nocardioides sp.]